MNERVAIRVVSIFAILLSALGCDQSAPASSSTRKEPISEWRNGRIVLGSPSLTSGIPGDGALTIDQIRDWLSTDGIHEPLDFVLPVGLVDATELITIPHDNPLTRAKIELGRQLFFDGRLSDFRTTACATCHLPEQDYSVHGVMPVSALNPPVCFNRLFGGRQFWDGRAESLEDQVEGPITNSFEMGTTPDECVARLRSIEGYQLQFQAIFGELNFDAVSRALANFQRALVTGPSPWDYRRLLSQYEDRAVDSLSPEERLRVRQLKQGVSVYSMSESAIRGEALFFSDRTRCHVCHSGPNLTDEAYHNVGTGMADDEPDLGRFDITQNEQDRGAFKTPTLRNVARTSPYMHNGQFDTLREVVNWFDRGGYDHPHLDRNVRPLNLTRDEKRDLVAFLEALTGALPPVETARLPQ
ncbi:MAG: cytochrome c peroxidase [Pirellulales bacterium]